MILTISVVELGLRGLGLVIQTGREASFEDGKTVDRDSKVNLRKELKADKWVLALGDSLTNGSNVSVNETYPFRLFHKEENRISDNKVRFNILNHGICESTTYQSLKQLKDILKKWNRVPDIIIYLGGAADLFSPISALQQEKVGEIVEDIEEHAPSFIRGLRIYKIYRGINLALKESFLHNSTLDITEDELRDWDPEVAQVLDFYLTGDVEAAEKFVTDKGLEVPPVKLETILNAVVDRLFIASKQSRVIEETLKFLEKHPELFEGFGRYPLHRMTMAYDFQSKYTAHDIAKRLLKIAHQSPNVLQTELYQKYATLFTEREKSIQRINRLRIQNIRELAEISKANGIKLILQNYPENFTDANIALEQVAKEYGLPLVDNNTVFNELIEKGNNDLFREHEHPSPEGYKLMASNVWKVLKKEIQVDKPN
ncbi:hypothetical protein BMS_3102 [Halobacteriovorax marinus SJ]|uniref:SGNH hydrolase-type esterase domain-containing protein n=1 Tax=Halobacteriovorax marinus (strain ATCC BAA-682 / DSM 15412 / SJ) TaxID=862908 RepID=E1WZH1_HALMS|nr:hypothetical protein BMS_3102 [Halobacteriovorax marinus SJ]